MANFFETVQEPTALAGNYIKPGINENVVFGGFTVQLDKNGKPQLIRSFYPEGGDPEKSTRKQYENFLPGVRKDGRGKESSNYVTWVTSVMHFLGALTTRENITKVLFETLPVPESEIDDLAPTEAQLDAFVSKMNPLVVGKTLRYKFKGEERISTTTGKLIVGTSLQVAFIPYAEAINAGCEKPVVAMADTKLKYNVDSKWDLKKLAVVTPDLDGFPGATDSAGF